MISVEFFCFQHNYHVYVNLHDGYANTPIAVLMFTSWHVNTGTSKNVYDSERGEMEISASRNCFAGMFWLGLHNRHEKLERKSNCMYRQAAIMPRMVIKVQETMLTGSRKALTLAPLWHDLFNKQFGKFMISQMSHNSPLVEKAGR